MVETGCASSSFSCPSCAFVVSLVSRRERLWRVALPESRVSIRFPYESIKRRYRSSRRWDGTFFWDYYHSGIVQRIPDPLQVEGTVEQRQRAFEALAIELSTRIRLLLTLLGREKRANL